MINTECAAQSPKPGMHMLMFRGDTLTFSLSVVSDRKGRAWLRTNLGHAGIARREIVREVHHKEPPLGEDWFDIPMIRIDERNFQVEIPLRDVGHFEAKCFFLRDGDDEPVWPPGENVTINVEPAENCCANIIYNAFVRQFGPNKSERVVPDPSAEGHLQALDRTGYAVIPPSGTFRDFIAELDFIIGELGCRIIHFLPIHPTPTTYARMGRFGSPYAALSFYAVDPALAEFDPRATPLEQFLELVDAVHERNARLFMDIAINHTGWAAALHEAHPEWLVRDERGRIEVPGAWGVQWSDLTKLDYSQKDLWQYMADVFLKWCRRGIDGFRCDAGYMLPVAAWKYIVARVRQQYPDTVFFLEGLGGEIAVTLKILNEANFDWAYSELFQNYNRDQIEHYLPGTIAGSGSDGLMVHFAETHDNPRLAAKSDNYARMRVGLCALCSVCGGFGFANGVEWLAKEKINVHDAPPLNWKASNNLVAFIRRLNLLLKSHPAFFDQTDIKLVEADGDNCIVLLRHHRPTGKKLLIIVNLDDENRTQGAWDSHQVDMQGTTYFDLISEKKITITASESKQTCILEAGQVLCLTNDRADLGLAKDDKLRDFSIPKHITKQRLRAKAMAVLCFYRDIGDISDFDVDAAAEQLAQHPIEFCRSLNHFTEESRVITWQWPEDVKREIMMPPRHFLLVRSENAFRARIIDSTLPDQPVLAHEVSLPGADGTYFALFSPLDVPTVHRPYTLDIVVYQPGKSHHAEATLLQLANPKNAEIKRCFNRAELLEHSRLLLGTNGRGAMLRAALSWGELSSRYDGLLAANLSHEFPEDRQIMFVRCRAWIVFQGFSQEICLDCLDTFCFDCRLGGLWRFRVPIGQGEHILFYARAEMLPGANTVRLSFTRCSAKGYTERLADTKAVSLILRPDIEDRSFHETTKAYALPEQHWLDSVTVHPTGFSFAPHPEHSLEVQISKGEFKSEAEWYYMVYRPLEAQRGMDPHSDLFSPGYFSIPLNGNDSVELLACVTGKEEPLPLPERTQDQYDLFAELMDEPRGRQRGWKLEEGLRMALDAYVVKRGAHKSVVAGYPWFLDWGRDSLIFARGLIAAGKIEDAGAVLKQFGQFEKDGTLPNMILGNEAANRDTSDASLWFITACADMIKQTGNERFLDERCGDRNIREVLFSIGRAFMAGTPNGIAMDPASGLIFSPAHFTWMDTNFPAGTPREGYAIEIQALWYAALQFLGQIDHRDVAVNWQDLAEKVKSSILNLFWLEDQGYLSDCLHAQKGETARNARPDDALRPNQLFAVTMGAVSDQPICRIILQSCEMLLVPGAIRSLADRDVSYPLEIVHQGKIINTPYHPYQGRYEGDEDAKRKPAYHNGTAWSWMFPVFCEAWARTYGDEANETALAWLASSTRRINLGCVGHVPEIVDGDFPHTHRGCDAQAWGASELLRVWLKLRH